MKRRIMLFLLMICLLLPGCGAKKPKRFQQTYFDLFDTVTTVVGYAENEAEFAQSCKQIYDTLHYYHQLFDIYNDYPGVNNLKTVNDNAGVAPVAVDAAIILLLKDCKYYAERTGGKVNAAMGSVLQLWHEARTNGLENPQSATLPSMDALIQASKHTNFDDVIIDEAASTVYIQAAALSLDVGAIAKGWASQRAAEIAPQGFLISVGGNVCVTGPKPDGTDWVIGIQNPDGEGYLRTLNVRSGCVVTSGDYQRTYTVDGKQYHHIIDPDTLMPSEYWRSVTIVCANSALADALSTALFNMTLEDGKALLSELNAEAFWLDADGNQFYTPGFKAILAG